MNFSPSFDQDLRAFVPTKPKSVKPNTPPLGSNHTETDAPCSLCSRNFVVRLS